MTFFLNMNLKSIWFKYSQKWKFFLKAKSLDQIHSPFLFNLTSFIWKNRITLSDAKILDESINYLKSNGYVFTKEELNPNLQVKRGFSFQSTIKSEFKRAAITPKKGELLHLITQFIAPKSILELGTNLGLSALYMGLSSHKSITELSTIEGCKDLSVFANEFLTDRLKDFKVLSYNGLFNEVLPQILKEEHPIDLVYNDGDHRSQSIIEYFEIILPYLHQNSAFILDDIYWNEDMNNGWKQLCNHPKVTLSLDLFELGILFINPDLSKENIQFRI